MSRLYKALENSADGAFVTDSNLRIRFWNRAAEEILGFGRKDSRGQFCYQLLAGIDDKGRIICREHCQVADALLQAQPVPDYDLQVQSKAGETCWLNVSVFPYQERSNGGRTMFVHLFREITQRKADETLFRRLLAAARRYQSTLPEKKVVPKNRTDLLTAREYEVLALMADGCSTDEISQRLSISPHTVRNHVQKILQKFQVHSRLEAVTYALKNNLLD